MEQDKYSRVVACLRCHLQVRVITDNCGLKLSYDVDHWIERCCCNHRSSPVDCCSFLTLEGLINSLPRSPKS